MKEMLVEALDKVGGVDYLVRCAKSPRLAAAFLGLVGRLITTHVVAEINDPRERVERLQAAIARANDRVAMTEPRSSVIEGCILEESLPN